MATGSILGTGLGTKGAEMRWGVAGRMVVAWLITLPAAALMGAVCWYAGSIVGGLGGVLVDASILRALAAYIYIRSRRQPVDASNVSADWERRSGEDGPHVEKAPDAERGSSAEHSPKEPA